MTIDKRRIKRLRERIPRPPSPEDAEHEREVARQWAILEAMHEIWHDYPGPLKDYPEERAEFVREAILLGLANHGLDEDEIQELAPEYQDMYLDVFSGEEMGDTGGGGT